MDPRDLSDSTTQGRERPLGRELELARRRLPPAGALDLAAWTDASLGAHAPPSSPAASGLESLGMDE
ncbi:hypothetical protein [Enhygromyxa salina]|uniref:hypothetical protein n=1 Tax=Enhygromyxa salina TaxID=215803 RepID=UPI000D09543A|nr:hypothetical protein [Enhygromyxa salina]